MGNLQNSLEKTSDVCRGDAQAALESLFDDPRFHASERTKNLLKYLAAGHFEGQRQSVKAYSIAVDILGRGSDFDATIDPIVRIEVSRLRAELVRYYQAFGVENGVSVTIPKGRYTAAFNRIGERYSALDDGADEVGEAPRNNTVAEPEAEIVPAVTPPVRIAGWRVSGALLLLAVVAAVAVLIWQALWPHFKEKPEVVVRMSAADERLADEAGLTRDFLMSALSRFQTLNLASADNLTRSLSTSLRPPQSNGYIIDLKYYSDLSDRSVWWQVVDAETGNMLRSGLESVSTEGRSPTAVREELVTLLSRRFATTRGVINTIETPESSDGSLGNSCVLRAAYELDYGSAADLAEAVDCLEKTVAAQPFNTDALAMLSRATSTPAASSNAESLASSLELANQAVARAPLSDRAYIALMMAQFHSGRTDAAITAGNRALALNPYNPEVTAKLGMVLFSAGYWDAGVSLARDANHSDDAVPRDAIVVLALDAYRRQDWSEASLLAEQVNSEDFTVRALRAASLGQLGSDRAAQRLKDFRSLAPDFEKTFTGEMATRQFQPALSSALATGLAKAGAQFALQPPILPF